MNAESTMVNPTTVERDAMSDNRYSVNYGNRSNASVGVSEDLV